MISAAKIAQVICAERQDPAVMLPGDSGGMAPQPGSRRLRPARLFGVSSAACAAFLLAWIVYLGVTLPAQAVAHEWRLAWVGMDVAEAAGLLVVTWAARRLLEMLIPAAIVTGTVLVCDAWFDVILSWGSSNWRWSVLSALAVELPLAALLFAAARQMIRRRSPGHAPGWPCRASTRPSPVGRCGRPRNARTARAATSHRTGQCTSARHGALPARSIQAARRSHECSLNSLTGAMSGTSRLRISGCGGPPAGKAPYRPAGPGPGRQRHRPVERRRPPARGEPPVTGHQPASRLAGWPSVTWSG
jgi:hypothetical protein